ncbi:hypothetical protein G7046_g3870 [Stylonectria norvegica]|nr:hypothetical protein G7046_g3870 [Stylonectria norvegica]
MADQPLPAHLVRYTNDERVGGDEGVDETSPISDDEHDEHDEDEGLLSKDSIPTVAPKRRWFQNQGKVLFSLVGVIAAVVVLSAPIYAITRLGHHQHQQSGSQGHPSPKKQTKPLKAVPYKLNFPALYPEMALGASADCRASWNALAEVPCHDKLFDRSSDNSTWMTYGWDPMYFLPGICEDRCRTALQEARSQLSKKCTSTDVFELGGYSGMFNTKWMEPGPAAAVDTLVRRTDHLCRSSSVGDSDFEFCPVEMLERFSVIDGMSVNLRAIDSFISQTDKKSTSPSRWVKGTRGSRGYSYSYKYKVREQSYGPGPGDTSCGWCTFDFLNHTLNSWTEGLLLSPDSDRPVSLPEFIRRTRVAGERCAPSTTWTKIYEEATAHYISAGLLPGDWEQSLPSGDMHYLIKNGPSLGDYPVSEIHAEYEHLLYQEAGNSSQSNDESQPQPGREALDRSRVCLLALQKHYLSSKCYINLPHEMLVKMIEDEKNPHGVREAYCSKTCTDALQSWSSTACASDTIPQVLRYVDEYLAARQQRQTYCDLMGQESNYWNCAKGLVNMNKTNWAFEGRPETRIFLSDLKIALEDVEQRLALPNKVPNNDQEASDRKKQKAAEDAERKRIKDLGNSVCAGCIWNWLTGSSLDETMQYIGEASSSSDYVDFAKKYDKTCTYLGATWLGGVPYGEDPVVWRVKDAQGDVVRYIQGPDRGWNPGAIFGVKEATGSVFLITKKRGTRPGIEVGSLWHVLQAERGHKARKENRLDVWTSEEESHRQEADKEIWNVDDWQGVSYIGPKDGVGGKDNKQAES